MSLRPRSFRTPVLGLVAVVSTLLGIGLATRGPDLDGLDLRGSVEMGSATAPVTLVEISDLRCPSCDTFATWFKVTLYPSYIETHKVKFAFLPAQLNSWESSLALAAICASDQGRFQAAYVPLHHVPERSNVPDIAKAIGLESASLGQCMSGNATSNRLAAQEAVGSALGTTTVPTFVVGLTLDDGTIAIREVLTGAASIQDVENALDSAIRKVTG